MKLLGFRIGASTEETETAALEQEILAAGARNYWCRKFGDPELDEIVEEHRAWVESRGELGKKAELEAANFQDADLMGAQLSGANLLRANLRGADLLVADLRGACLIEADLSEANLVSTNLRGASLAGANLATAMGLVARQLGGASLIGAALPEALFPFEGIAKSASVCVILRILLGAMMAMCACLWAGVAFTSDIALVKNAPAPLPLVGRVVPILAFYLAAPMLLAGVYVGFHSCLQKLWDAMEELPAVFPDGRRLSECVPLAMMALAPQSLRDADPEQRKTQLLRRMLWHVAGYWIVPATLVLVWARYLSEQDWRGSLLQIFFILAAAAMSGFLPRNEASMFAAAETNERAQKRLWDSWRVGGLSMATSAGCIVLVILTLGVTLGAPRQLSRAPWLSASNFRRWPAYAFSLAGYDPFPNLLGARISTISLAGPSESEDLKLVHGARLANASLRYARASGAFFAKSQMEHADLTGGDFATADFRASNLTSANFTSASL
ncbi:MAG TPA: pentapeptide repeat-containing protein, partial [Verrucomicrobiae bacterium]|nr:pentapeptide repeat-containing protein [Verrucomicrobiae bacterium]